MSRTAELKEEAGMAKGEQKSNRETKKPKKAKVADTTTATPFASVQKKVLDAAAAKKGK